MTDTSSTITWLRWVAVAEALSYVALLVAVVVKYGFDQPAGVSAIGPVHGMLFLAYMGLVLLARDELRWSGRETLLAILASAIPLGGVLVERRMLPQRGS
jgi:integral membrane protein